jgi:hypothetical protein
MAGTIWHNFGEYLMIFLYSSHYPFPFIEHLCLGKWLFSATWKDQAAKSRQKPKVALLPGE